MITATTLQGSPMPLGSREIEVIQKFIKVVYYNRKQLLYTVITIIAIVTIPYL